MSIEFVVIILLGFIVVFTIYYLIVFIYRKNKLVQEVKQLALKVDKMTGIEFETFVAATLNVHKDFDNILLKGGSGDKGIDITANYKNIPMAIQCKRSKNKVGRNAVEEIFVASGRFGFEGAMLVTNSELDPTAAELADDVGVEVVDSSNLFILIGEAISEVHSWSNLNKSLTKSSFKN